MEEKWAPVASNEPENWRQLRYALYILSQRDEARYCVSLSLSLAHVPSVHNGVHAHGPIIHRARTGPQARRLVSANLSQL